MDTSTDGAFSRINQTYRARHSPLPQDKTMSLERLNHLIYGRRRDEKVPLNVGFRRRDAKPEDVLFDETQILALA